MLRSHLLILLLSMLFAAGCSENTSSGHGNDNNGLLNNETNNTTNNTTNNATNNVTNNGGQCGTGMPWVPGTQAFVEVTDTWLPPALGVLGQRTNAVDIDDDGWVDLVIRLGGTRPDDFATEGGRRSWVLRNTGHGSFEDVTVASGLRQPRQTYEAAWGHSGEVFAFGDVNNDGFVDAYVGANVTDPNDPTEETSELYLGAAGGTFVLGPEDNPLRRVGESDVPSGAVFVDVDRDGNLDLWITQAVPDGGRQPNQDHLFRGDGTGQFEDVTEAFGLTTGDWTTGNLNYGRAHSNAWSATACDLNNDGTPELMAASYGRAPNHLWQGVRGDDGAVEFDNRSTSSRYAFDDRTDWSDNQSARCWCKLHPTAEDCAGVPPPDLIRCTTDADAFRWNHDSDREPFRLGGNSGTTTCADVNNDGWMDLLTSEIVHWDVGSTADPSELLVNLQKDLVKFDRPGNEVTGLTRVHDQVDWNDGDITGTAFDFDNDGWPDIYIGSTDYPGARGLLFHQSAPLSFEPVPLADGLDHTRSHGIVAADFDHDGDLDLFVGHSRARCGDGGDCYPTAAPRLFENVTGNANAWIQLDLRGATGANASAIGARVQVTANGVTQTQEVAGGYGHYGAQTDHVLHFGAGSACTAVVEVRWPDDALTTQTFTLETGARYRVVKGHEPVAQP